MLLDPLKIDSYRFGRFKKCKYSLLINNDIVYSFVTTIRDERDCVDVLLNKAKNYKGFNYRNYKIIKINEKGKFLVSKGKLINL
jgi:hypothetical protein